MNDAPDHSGVHAPRLPRASLYLASRSPRRRALLEQLGLRPTVVAADIDETPREDEAPEAYVQRIATAKAQAGWAALAPTEHPTRLLAADTAVVVGERVLGKPADVEDGLRMLALLSARRHRVLTAVTLMTATVPAMPAPAMQQRLCCTEVAMRRIGRDEALAYWATGEPRDKAGGYAVQGLGAIFVAAIDGSYSNVVGLPLYETATLLREHGLDLLAPVDDDASAEPSG